MTTYDQSQDKPMLLKAVETILANPADIKNQIYEMEKQYNEQYKHKKSQEQIRDLMCNHVIDNYSYYTAFSGGVTALAGVVPGLGTIISSLGGATADAALCMKWQIEMVMAIAVAYGRDITIEDERNLCLMIAGLGAINEASKTGAKTIGSKAFTNMLRQYLKGPALQGTKEVFKKLGVTFTRKAAEKSIPFGVGVIIGAGANKVLTKYVGSKAKDFYKVTCDETEVEVELA